MNKNHHLAIILSILSVFGSFLSYSQSHTIQDTLLYPNGNIYQIHGWDTLKNRYSGVFQTFDTSGTMLINGNYELLDSVECYECYEKDNISGSYISYNKLKSNIAIRIESWEFYYSNGQLKETGAYCKSIHEYSGMNYPFKWGNNWPEPVSGYVSHEYLKDGTWTYYNEDGTKTMIEEYKCGNLVSRIKNLLTK